MARKLRESVPEAEPEVGKVEIDVADPRPAPVIMQKRVLTFKPFQGDTKNLARPELDKKGRLKKSGQAEFYLHKVDKGFDFMKVFRNRMGVARRLVSFLKTALDTPACRKNRKFVESLKKAGIPVYE